MLSPPDGGDQRAIVEAGPTIAGETTRLVFALKGGSQRMLWSAERRTAILVNMATVQDTPSVAAMQLFAAPQTATATTPQTESTDPRVRLKQSIADGSLPEASQKLVDLLRRAAPDLKLGDLSERTAAFALMDDPGLWQVMLDSQHEAIMSMLRIMAEGIAENSRLNKKTDEARRDKGLLRKVVEVAVEDEGIELAQVTSLLEQYGLGGLAPGSVELQAARPRPDRPTAGADSTPAGASPALGEQPTTVGIGTRPSARVKPTGWR